MGTPEDEIRDALAKQLGVDFYSPDDPELSIDVSKPPPQIESPAAERLRQSTKQVTVAELITRCTDATKLMGKQNPHRILLWNCAFALRQLVDRLEAKGEN